VIRALTRRDAVVPDSFIAYFTGAATAAGALVGLLFIAVSLRPEAVMGAGTQLRAVAGSAFTALVNGFFVSLIALIPSTNLGYTAVIMGLISLYNTYKLHRGLEKTAVPLLALSLAAYLTQFVAGILLIARPGLHSLVYTLAYVLVGAFATALGRAWALIQGDNAAQKPEATQGRHASQPQET
jgi:hypothetical protein